MTPICQKERLLLPAGEQSFVLPRRRAHPPLLTCPACRAAAIYLYHDEDTPAGACLSCKIDAESAAAMDARPDETAADHENCCICGID